MQTVYPTTREGFPPASFKRLGDAFAYCKQMTDLKVGGVKMCPAKHWSA